MTTEWPACEGPAAFPVSAADATRLEAALTEAVTWFGEEDPGPLEAVVVAVDPHEQGHDDDPSLSFAYADCRVRVEPGRSTVERASSPRDARPLGPRRDHTVK